MSPNDFKRIRKDRLRLTQQELAEKLHTTRMTITRYEIATRSIPGVVEVAMKQLAEAPVIPMLGLVAAGKPIEPVVQAESVEVPPMMARQGKNFALRVTGESMRDEGILAGDLVIVRKQSVARNGEIVVALVNGEATIKKYFRKGDAIELRPANPAMKPILVTSRHDIDIQGVLVGVIRICA